MVDVALPARANGYPMAVAVVRYPASFVHCETFGELKRPVESFWYTRDVPFDWRTVEEAPIVVKPVPPFARVRAFVRRRVPMLA